ncbi:hypothetical protein HPB47_011913 [Ixodes persulcatus]|uniref:Uncharacterized protein n=1 Tax=Ixodes persulcatus TaxID=34615 RepID=A0AC60NV63_IXOPE|nr:hypothetical protein HPB47_011913 [Ixodes persulcatus]
MPIWPNAYAARCRYCRSSEQGANQRWAADPEPEDGPHALPPRTALEQKSQAPPRPGSSVFRTKKKPAANFSFHDAAGKQAAAFRRGRQRIHPPLKHTRAPSRAPPEFQEQPHDPGSYDHTHTYERGKEDAGPKLPGTNRINDGPSLLVLPTHQRPSQRATTALLRPQSDGPGLLGYGTTTPASPREVGRGGRKPKNADGNGGAGGGGRHSLRIPHRRERVRPGWARMRQKQCQTKSWGEGIAQRRPRLGRMHAGLHVFEERPNIRSFLRVPTAYVR